MNDASAAIALGRRIDLAREPDILVAGFRIRPTACEVSAAGRRVHLQPRVMQVLIALARAGGEPVSRETLIEACWGDVTIGEDALNRCIQRLRRLAGTVAYGAFTVETIPRVGYRLTVGGVVLASARQAEPVSATPTKPSVAVLPFANLTGDRDRAYFADGVTEAIALSLSRARTLFVVADGPRLPQGDRGSGRSDAAGELGPRYLLSGNVRKEAGRIRIDAKLTNPSDGVQLWGGRFDEASEDPFTLQDKVAIAVAGGVEPAVVAAEMRWVLKHPSNNPNSYELYLRGLRHCRKRDREEYRTAIEFLNRSIALDPEYRLALALAAHMHSLVDRFGWAEDPEANRARGTELAERAIMLAGDDTVVLAHAGTAISLLNRDPAAADLLARAVALNPANSYIWHLSGHYHAHLGDADTALEHLLTSLRLEPIAHRSNVVGAMAAALFRKGRFEESVAFGREAVRTADGPMSNLMLAGGCAQLGLYSEAAAALRRYRALTTLPIDIFARRSMNDTGERKLLLDSIAAVEAASQLAGDDRD
jgi:TolB-like protein